MESQPRSEPIDHEGDTVNNDNLLTSTQGTTAQLSGNTVAALWGAAAVAINAVKADELEAIATELRARPALRGVPATVDARWLEVRAAKLRGGVEGEA